MKKMTTNIKTLAALLMASATFAACSSDDANSIADQPVQQPAGQQVYTMTVNASKGGDAATSRALALDGTTLNARWATTENIYVKKGDTWATGSLKPQSDGTTATLKGSLSGITIAKDDVLTLQFPRSGEMDYTGQVGTLADIAAKYDYATATVTVESVSATGNITPTEATTTFTNQQAIVKFTLKNGDDALSATKLVVAVGSTEYEVNPESAASEIYVAIPGFSSQTVTLTATVGSDTYTYEKSGVTFENGKYYAITVKMTAQASTPTGALSGKFTINSSGGKVYFSQGNLQYQASTGTWRFAEHQYDFVGDASNGNVYVDATKSSNASVSSTYAGWIDLFGWGTSGSAPSGQTAREPYYTTTTNASYVSNITTTGTSWGVGSEWDWGHNAISNGGNTADTWRTLTSAEWTYVFNTRSTTSGIRYAKATVNSVSGVILLPDDWSTSYHSLSSTNTTNAAFTTNSITLSDWTNDFEAHGCVFLPAAGYRYGTSVNGVGSYGYYWSSTAYGTDYAYSVLFVSGSVDPAGYLNRYYGFSVRLVRPVE